MSTNSKVNTTSSQKKSSKRKKVARITVSPVAESMIQLETAYNDAINGKIKFGEVKTIFKQLHKEIKKTVKSQK